MSNLVVEGAVDKIRRDLGEILLFILVCCPLWIVSILMRGWAFACLWRWYVVPNFGLPVLSIAMGAGAYLLFRVLQPWPSSRKKEDEEEEKSEPLRIWPEIRSVIESGLFCLFTIGLGWTVLRIL